MAKKEKILKKNEITKNDKVNKKQSKKEEKTKEKELKKWRKEDYKKNKNISKDLKNTKETKVKVEDPKKAKTKVVEPKKTKTKAKVIEPKKTKAKVELPEKPLKPIFKKTKDNDIVLAAAKKSRLSLNNKYKKGLKTSKDSFTRRFLTLATKHRKIDEAYFQELEDLLITSDVGVEYSLSLIVKLKESVKRKNITDPTKVTKLIFDHLFEKYLNGEKDSTTLNIIDGEVNVIIVIGVNGVGKTTSIGKLAKRLIDEGKKVSFAAADTFRAGAVAQLQVWADRNSCEITVPKKEGQDPASVVYEAIEKANTSKPDVLIVDTAGRLQNKENLMNELKKLNKIIETKSGKPPVESLLVLDATTGQNGVRQAEAFNDLLNLTGIILTKMDSSSKGGIILNIKDSFKIPVKFIGLGESIDDFEEFDLEKYLSALTGDLDNE